MIVNREKLSTILEKHKHWINEDCEGWENMKANLYGANLCNANLCYVWLCCKYFGSMLGIRRRIKKMA